MGITSKLLGWWMGGPASSPDTHSARLISEGCIEIDDPDSVILGCGWFDSSHDLRAGLAVVEGEALELQLAVERMYWGASDTSLDHVEVVHG